MSVLAATAMTFVGGWTTGVSVDEPVHVQRLDNYLNTGWYVTDFESQAGLPLPGETSQYVYGPAAMLVLHGVNLVLGIDAPGTVSTTATAYAVRHLVVGLLALLCAVAVAAIVRLLLGRWGWGVVAMAALGAVPMWTGHAMFNVKDVPVAAGYTWVTLGLVIAAREDLYVPWRWLGPVLVAAGTTLAMGTRPAMWAGVAAAVVVFVVGSLLMDRGVRWLRYFEVGFGLALAALLLLLIYPHVFSHPIGMVMRSTAASVDYGGAQASYFVVWHNVPLLLPVLILLLAAGGMLVAALRALRHLRRSRSVDVGMALVGAQVFALPVVTSFHHSGVSNNLKQLLFAVPAVAVFVAVAAAWLLAPERSRWLRRSTAVVPALALILPLIPQAEVFPYNYAQRSVLVNTGILSGGGWSADYWGTSARELAPQIPPTGKLFCTPQWNSQVLALREGLSSGTADCKETDLSPLSMYTDSMAGQQPALKSTQFWAEVQSWSQNLSWPSNCKPVAEVTRRVLGQTLIMSKLVRCDLPYPTLGLTPVYFSSSDAWAYLGQGWWFFSGVPHAASSGSTATLNFAIDPSLAGKRLKLVLGSDQVIGAVRVTLNGKAVSADRPSSKQLALSVPASIRKSSPEHPLRVTLSTSDGSPLLMGLTSVRLERP